jgi:uncharacterized protein YndB with AHSA1/START domain
MLAVGFHLIAVKMACLSSQSVSGSVHPPFFRVEDSTIHSREEVGPMEITYSVRIDTVPETVFDRLEAPELAKEWQKGVGETEILHDTPERIGTTFREMMTSNEGALEMMGEIIEFIPDRAIAFHLESKMHEIRVRYLLEPLSTGTRLDIQSTIRWKFPMNIMELFFGKKISSNILEELRGECDELKRLCETEAG